MSKKYIIQIVDKESGLSRSVVCGGTDSLEIKCIKDTGSSEAFNFSIASCFDILKESQLSNPNQRKES